MSTTFQIGDRVTSPVAWESGEGVVSGFEDGQVMVSINKGVYACSPGRLTLIPVPTPTDAHGNAIHAGDRVALPWGKGTVIEPGFPRSTVKYDSGAGGELLGALNSLIKILEVAA